MTDEEALPIEPDPDLIQYVPDLSPSPWIIIVPLALAGYVIGRLLT